VALSGLCQLSYAIQTRFTDPSELHEWSNQSGGGGGGQYFYKTAFFKEMVGLPRSEESSKEEAIHTFSAPIAAPLPSHRGPLLRYCGNSDKLAARPIIAQPPRDPARCSRRDVQKELCIPDPISFLRWLYLARLEKGTVVRVSSPQRNPCGGRARRVARGL